jgi:diacylglycerol kinase
MSVLPRPPMMSDEYEAAPVNKPPRPWSLKFADAFRGLKLGMRGHSSFSVHFFFAALVITGAIVLSFSLEQWCILLACIGMVLAAELFNSALENLVRGLGEYERQRLAPCLDIAAGAVLMASITASVIGILIFVAVFLRHFDVI